MAKCEIHEDVELVKIDCPDCDGDGDCETCGGEGQIEVCSKCDADE